MLAVTSSMFNVISNLIVKDNSSLFPHTETQGRRWRFTLSFTDSVIRFSRISSRRVRAVDPNKNHLVLQLHIFEICNTGKALIDNCHYYTSTLTTAEDFMDEFPPLPITPSKLPAPKKMMYTVGFEQTNPNNIMASLSAQTNTRSDSIESTVSANALKIEGLKKTIDFVCAEIKDVKNKEKQADTCQQRVSELERYSRRWNLRIHRVEESEYKTRPSRSVRLVFLRRRASWLTLLTPCIGSAPSSRLTANPEASLSISWKAAKTSQNLRDNGLRFAEDLSEKDSERRNKLWPVINKAREEGKPASFRGGHGFISGSEVPVPT